MCEEVSCRPAFVLAESEGALDGTTVPGGGGGNGPRCWAAKGNASAAHARINTVLTTIFLRLVFFIGEMSTLLLSGLLVTQSLLYFKIRCVEQRFRNLRLAHNKKINEAPIWDYGRRARLQSPFDRQ